MSEAIARNRMWFVVALLVVALFSAQAMAGQSIRATGTADTGRVLGNAGFAYLTGLRTFAAAVLWNRIEPILHNYYDGVPIAQQKYTLPTMRMVTFLDPQFTTAYYVASFTVASGGNVEEGLDIARDGLEKNPRSGLLMANLAQLLMMQDKAKNLPEMLELARKGTGNDVNWQSADDAVEGAAIFRAVFKLAGDEQQVQRMDAALQKLRASGEVGTDHDHDGDGVQDH